MGPDCVRATLIIPIAEWSRAVGRIRRRFRVCQHRMWPHNVHPASTERPESGVKEGDLFSGLFTRDHPNKEVKLSGFLLKPEAAPALCCSNEKPLTNISGQGSCGEQPPPNVQHKEGSSCKCPHLIDAVGGCLGAWGFQHRLSFSRRTFHLIVAAF